MKAQIEILNEIIKKTIKRIKELQLRLVKEKEEYRLMGSYEDCGEFYKDEVKITEAVIKELISQKIAFEKWRKKLKYEY